jgi:hypothetical protein
MTAHPKKSESIEVREKLLESAQKMKWHTPDGWEVQDLIPVEYVMEVFEALYNQRMELNQAETRLSEAAWWYKNHTNKVYKKLGMLKQRYEQMQERYDFLRTRAGINKKEDSDD